MQVAVAEARTLVEAGNRVAFFASSTGEVERLADIFNEYAVPYQLGLEQSESTPAYLAERAYMAGSVASIYLVKGLVRRGTAFPDSKLAVFGSEDLFETSELVARAPASKSALATFSADIIDLKPGDYVVHAEHGVAQFLGLREIVQGEPKGDYMLLEYAGRRQALRAADPHGPGAALPRRGRSQAGARPHGRRHLDPHQDHDQSQNARHGGRAAEALRPAQDGRRLHLLARQQLAARVRRRLRIHRDQGPAHRDSRRSSATWKARSRWTGCCAATSASARPKSSCARRSRRWATASRWRCSRPPQCWRSSISRRSSAASSRFPVRVEMFSRFRSPKEMKASLADLAEGKVDIAIGTHRLLSQDVQFNDLGLVIVDEEQRFGVKHKERLKQLKKAVDVLTMSATPIPRTLHMSLLGLRDMSVIETPPKDRLSIQTVVAPFDPELIRSAIEQELAAAARSTSCTTAWIPSGRAPR